MAVYSTKIKNIIGRNDEGSGIENLVAKIHGVFLMLGGVILLFIMLLIFVIGVSMEETFGPMIAVIGGVIGLMGVIYSFLYLTLGYFLFNLNPLAKLIAGFIATHHILIGVLSSELSIGLIWSFIVAWFLLWNKIKIIKI